MVQKEINNNTNGFVKVKAKKKVNKKAKIIEATALESVVESWLGVQNGPNVQNQSKEGSLTTNLLFGLAGVTLGCYLMLTVTSFMNTGESSSGVFGVNVQRFVKRASLPLMGKKKSKKPNVIVFLADDLGFNDVGYHGSPINTPTIDKLAEEGVKLENMYVAPICTPTRGMLMSGRYTIHTGLTHLHIEYNAPHALTMNATLFPQKLQDAGYRTYMLGKWHLGHSRWQYVPHNRGFHKHYGIYTGHANHYTHRFTQWVNSLVENGVPQFDKNGTFMTHMYTDKAIEYLDDHLDNHGDKPFFMYFAHEAVHTPLQSPEKYTKQYQGIINDPKRKVYAGMASCMDEAIKNITKYLKKNDLYDNTVIFFSSDNGGFTPQGANNFPLREGKGTLYEGGVRVPAFVHSPLIKKPGREIKELFHITDLYPTIVKLAGGNITDADWIDGHDQWSTISEGKASSRKEVLLNIDLLQQKLGDSMFPDVYDTGVRSAIRVGDWKLTTGYVNYPLWQQWFQPYKFFNKELNKTKNVFLYNLERDPGEKNDLFFKAPEKVQELLKRLASYRKTQVANCYSLGDPKFVATNSTVLPWLS